MKGMIFKELRQNKIAFIFAALMTPLFFCLFIFVSSFIDGEFESLEYGLKTLYDSDSIATVVLLYVMGMALVDAVSATMFKADETKKWAYFISSTPVLPRGHVLIKYISALVMAVCMLVSFFLTNAVMSLCAENCGIEILFDVKKLFIPLFLTEIVLKVVDIPFLVRFSSDNGGKVKAAALLVLMITVVIYALFGPLPVDTEEFTNAIIKFALNFSKGVYDHLFNRIKLISAGAVAVLFVLSYFISTKLYLKGIETYDK